MSNEREVESPTTPPEKATDSSAKTEENDDDDFEFAFVVRDYDTNDLIAANEIFFNGQIRSVYPVFNQDLVLIDDGEGEKTLEKPLTRLVIEDRELSCSDHHLEGIRPATYCVWKPGKSDKCRKSGSTGSRRRWRIRDLLVRRSHSDGKEKFVFVESLEKGVGTMVEGGKGKGKQATEAHQRYDCRNAKGGTAKGAAVGKSFLPYKPEILGFLASVKGSSRIHQPF